MAYTGVTAPFWTEMWGNPDWISGKAVWTTSDASTATRTYTNRKLHASSGSYHFWTTDGAPDPTMSETTPPYPKNEYSDHVAVEVILTS